MILEHLNLNYACVMLENISLCVIKIEIDLEASAGKNALALKTQNRERQRKLCFSHNVRNLHAESEGAVSSEHPTNPRVQRSENVIADCVRLATLSSRHTRINVGNKN